MHSIDIKPRFLPAMLCAGLFLCAPAQASGSQGHDGSVLLRMCKGADNVKMLSVMCHSYLDGFTEAAHYYGKGKAAFCLDADDSKKAPGMIVKWIEAHPESMTQPAADVLQQALTALYSCKGRK